MIKVLVKLHGALQERVPGYDPDQGLALEFARDARVRDLTRRLNLAPEDTGVVAMDGRVADPDAPLYEGANVRIFQAAFGG